MKILQTSEGLARLEGDDIVSVLDVGHRDLDAVLAAGDFDLLATAAVRRETSPAEVDIAPLLSRPERFVIAGLNYRAHCEEIGRPVPERLVFGMAPGTAVHAAGQPVLIPSEAPAEVDYEGELAIVIGRTAANVQAADAWSVIAGFAPLNDVSARDVQAEGTLEAVGRAKGFPTFKPLGPCLATIDEFSDPLDIGLTTHVNGEIRQQGRTGDMVFAVPQIVEIVTSKQTLQAGDVICTGTPGGVAHGGQYPYLVDGDLVEINIEGLPTLTNRFVSAP